MKSSPSYQELVSLITKLQKKLEISKSEFFSQKEHTYHSLFENMSEGFARCQILYKNNKPIDFIYLEVNKAFEKLTGLKNVVGKPISEILPNHIDENSTLFNMYERVSRTGISEKIETFVPSLEMWFSISAYSSEKGQFLVIFDNITERKKIQESLKYSEAQFRGLFIQSHVGTAIVGLDKRFIKVNESLCNFLGYTENEMLGKTITEFTHPEDTEIGIEDMKRIVKGELSFSKAQKRYLKKDGTIAWGEITISIVKNESKKPLYFLPIIQDITERKNTELLIRENERKLKNLNDTKDKLFSIIAHDLRSPFNSILGFSELLIEHSQDFEIDKSEKFLEIINSSAKNALSLLNNLLHWAKTQTGQISNKPQIVSLAPIINNVVALSCSNAKAKNIKLKYKQPSVIEAYTDVNMLKVVLRNLISNAIKFTNVNGKIDIFTIQNENHIEIKVSDNGVGMPKETQQKLFNINPTIVKDGTAAEKGTGLGLILCKEFVEKLNGKIWVESELGIGSSFIFTLPIKKVESINFNS
ncbi:PAS domain S-box protein [Lutibacter holmesii]|uniref:histidine kinase n=1 Tax=Lutibacter holmesii TaxID=1137985 RepID=A0ABW3WUM3_9FLAO